MKKIYIIKRNKYKELYQYQHSQIKFTMETENHSKLAFLNVLVSNKPNREISV